jgi:Ala-tRNA(Pro) deacylase
MSNKIELFKKLKDLKITYQVFEHEPLFTVEQAKAATGHIPAAGCKNLFLKDSKKRLWLIVALDNTKIELKKVSKEINAPELRFADSQLLLECLRVKPGSVTPFGLINDINHEVTVILDSKLFEHNLAGFHPLENSATVTISPQDLERFIYSCGNKLIVFDFVNLNIVS